MAKMNPLAMLMQGMQSGFDTRQDPGQISSRTGRSLMEDAELAEAGGDPYGDVQNNGLGYGPSLGRGTDGATYRGVNPKWAPGEFDEWKQGKMTGLGTNYGRNKQAIFEAGPLAGLLQQLQQTMPQRNLEEASNMGFRGMWAPKEVLGRLGRTFDRGWEQTLTPDILKRLR